MDWWAHRSMRCMAPPVGPLTHAAPRAASTTTRQSIQSSQPKKKEQRKPSFAASRARKKAWSRPDDGFPPKGGFGSAPSTKGISTASPPSGSRAQNVP